MNYIFFVLIRNELSTTDTLENAIATQANIGLRSHQKNGYRSHAASGIPTILYIKAQNRFCCMPLMVIRER